MSNKGKFIDRSPNLRIAGRIVESDDNVGDSLKLHSKEEAAANIMHIKCQAAKEKARVCTSPFLPEEHVKDLLSPESKKSRFVEFRDKLSEDMFCKTPVLGKVLALQTKPDTFTNENFTYGIKRPKSENSYELILPKKSAAEVTREYANWHDKYIISHNHYFPSERIQRHYNEKFNANATFGIRNKVDTTGRMVRQCMQQCNHLMVINKAQKKFTDRTIGRLGSSINCTEINLVHEPCFGKLSQPDNCDARALVEDIVPCTQKYTKNDSIAHVNKLRHQLCNRTDFHMYDLKTLLHKYDAESKGFITLSSIFKALRSLLIRVNEDKIRRALTHFKIVLDEGQPNERLNLDLFWKLLHIQYPLPHTSNTTVVPKNVYNKDTTYRSFCSDRDKHLAYHPLQESIHKLSDDDRTRAADCISPNISMHFGLAPSDFEALRCKGDLRKIFGHLLGDNFEKTWELARVKTNGDVNCKLSVNDLMAAVDRCSSK